MIRFISFEGGDGSGKTTQVKLLEEYLLGRGEACVSTREPGGTELGKMIRQVLLKAGEEAISSPAEAFLYLADRAQHVQTVILPALADGKIVLCDRFMDSTVAYQGYGRGIDLALLRQLNGMASRDVAPDLTFLLDCPVEVGLGRVRRKDRFEREEIAFHQKVRLGFAELAREEPRRIRVLDATRSVAQIHEEIRAFVERKLAEIA